VGVDAVDGEVGLLVSEILSNSLNPEDERLDREVFRSDPVVRFTVRVDLPGFLSPTSKLPAPP
jgi:hypothetical protein